MKKNNARKEKLRLYIKKPKNAKLTQRSIICNGHDDWGGGADESSIPKE